MTVKFVPSGRGKAQCPPNPDYPNGIVLEIAKGTPCCRFDFEYPAPECGWHEVVCDKCGITIIVTAAGRPDDPVSITLPCIITPRITAEEN